MSKTVEQYKSELDRLQQETEQLEKLKIPAEEEFTEASQKLSDAETLKKSNDFALSSLKNSKIWLLLLAVAVVFDITAVLIALYWQKDIDVHNFAEGFVYNGSPTIFVGMSVVLYLVGGIMAISRAVNKKKLSAQCMESDVAYVAASKVYDEKKAVYDDLSGKIKALEDERERVKEEFLTAYPEERKKLNDKKEWQTPAEICQTFRLERRMFKELLTEGVRRGIVKTLIFSPYSQKQQQRIDAASFQRFLEAGGCLN